MFSQDKQKTTPLTTVHFSRRTNSGEDLLNGWWEKSTLESVWYIRKIRSKKTSFILITVMKRVFPPLSTFV